MINYYNNRNEVTNKIFTLDDFDPIAGQELVVAVHPFYKHDIVKDEYKKIGMNF